jgi:protein SCO1/2
MDAMTMSFDVRRAKMLDGVTAGTTIDFTFVVDSDSSYAENVRIRKYQNLEQEPLETRRLSLLGGLANPAATAAILNVEQQVPNFMLTDQDQKQVALSQLNGKVVVVSFAYVRCPNPAYCFRLTSNLAQLKKHFADRLGRELILLTVLIDSEHDQDDAVANYAKLWNADPQTWHFLTGPLPDVKRVARMFGMEFWNQEGFLTHSFHTVIVDRQGKLAANLEGNQFTSQQLADLVQAVMNRP